MKFKPGHHLSATDIACLNLQYLPRLTVKDSEKYLINSQKKSARVRRSSLCKLDVAYGSTSGQVCDIFPARDPSSPVQIFIHGGYWRAQEIQKDTYSHLAKPFTRAGATVVIPNYDLCPKVSISTIVMQIRKLIKWIYKNIHIYNGDNKRIFLSGHSAGGHLTAMMAATDWSKEGRLPKNLLKGIAPISGLFDIREHRYMPLLQSDLKLTIAEAKAMSPMYLTPHFKGTSIIAVGESEPDLFHWQSLSYAAHLRINSIRAEYISMPDDNHFSITDRLGNYNDLLTQVLIRQMGLR